MKIFPLLWSIQFSMTLRRPKLIKTCGTLSTIILKRNWKSFGQRNLWRWMNTPHPIYFKGLIMMKTSKSYDNDGNPNKDRKWEKNWDRGMMKQSNLREDAGWKNNTSPLKKSKWQTKLQGTLRGKRLKIMDLIVRSLDNSSIGLLDFHFLLLIRGPSKNLQILSTWVTSANQLQNI